MKVLAAMHVLSSVIEIKSPYPFMATSIYIDWAESQFMFIWRCSI